MRRSTLSTDLGSAGESLQAGKEPEVEWQGMQSIRQHRVSYRRREGAAYTGHGYLHGCEAYWKDKIGSLREPPVLEPECLLPNSQPRLQPKPVMAVQASSARLTCTSCLWTSQPSKQAREYILQDRANTFQFDIVSQGTINYQSKQGQRLTIDGKHSQDPSLPR